MTPVEPNLVADGVPADLLSQLPKSPQSRDAGDSLVKITLRQRKCSRMMDGSVPAAGARLGLQIRWGVQRCAPGGFDSRPLPPSRTRR